MLMFTHVLDNIYMVSTGNGVFPSSFSFYIDDEVKTLIDTPLDNEFPTLFKDRPVNLIINTHFHRDHSGSNHLFPEAKVYVHPLDAPAMQSAEVFSDFYGLNDPENLYLKPEFLKWLNFKPSRITKHINDGEIIELGQTKLEVIHTPGHTLGHCALFDKEKGIVYSGDIDLTGFGPWYGNKISNVDDTIISIEKIIKLSPDIILTGHKGIINKNVEARLKKYLDKVYVNEENILKALREPLTLDELVEHKIIYGRWYEPPILYAFFEKISLRKHLERLINLGLVNFEKGYYQATNTRTRRACSH